MTALTRWMAAMASPVILHGAMDHDRAKENWKHTTNRYPGCSCPPWRYSPAHPAPTNPECPTHGLEAEAIFYAQKKD